MNSDILWYIFTISDKCNYQKLFFLESKIWYTRNYVKWRKLLLVSTYTLGRVLSEFGNDELYAWLDRQKMITNSAIYTIHQYRKEAILYDVLRDQVPDYVREAFKLGERAGCLKLLSWFEKKIEFGSLKDNQKYAYRTTSHYDCLCVFDWITKKLELHQGILADTNCWNNVPLGIQDKIDPYCKLCDLFGYERCRQRDLL